MSERRFKVEESEAGLRMDVFVRRRMPSLSRARSKNLASEGRIRLDGRRCSKGTRVEPGQIVHLELDEGTERRRDDFRAVPNDTLPLAVLHEDDDCVVLNKPAGLPMHPLVPTDDQTLCNALVARYPEMANVGYSRREPGILHRLDNDTTGVVLAARHTSAFERLRDALRSRRFDKRYHAQVVGRVRAPQIFDLPLASGKNATRAFFDERRSAESSGSPALTEVLEATPLPNGQSLVHVRARSARRHQVRAHLAAYGHPLIGDPLYGGPATASRHLLHASAIHFESHGGPLRIESPLPDDFNLPTES